MMKLKTHGETILNIEEPMEYHFYWPDLDIDLSLEIIKHPEDFPLQSNI